MCVAIVSCMCSVCWLRSHWQMVWDLSQLTEHIQDVITMHESTSSNYKTSCKNTYGIVYYHVYNDPIYVTCFEFYGPPPIRVVYDFQDIQRTLSIRWCHTHNPHVPDILQQFLVFLIIIKKWTDICRMVQMCRSIKGSVCTVLWIYIADENRPCENWK